MSESLQYQVEIFITSCIYFSQIRVACLVVLFLLLAVDQCILQSGRYKIIEQLLVFHATTGNVFLCLNFNFKQNAK